MVSIFDQSKTKYFQKNDRIATKLYTEIQRVARLCRFNLVNSTRYSIYFHVLLQLALFNASLKHMFIEWNLVFYRIISINFD